MKNLRNERGVALMMALVLTLIGLAVVLAVLYFITQGMQLSASSRRYKSALEASYGGMEVFTKEIMPLLIGGSSLAQITAYATDQGLVNVLAGTAPEFNPNFTTYSSCMKTKLALPTSNWGAMCAANSASPEAKDGFDMRFTLKGPPLQSNFNVYAKIIDSLPGNSDLSGLTALDAGAGVAYGAAGVSPMHIPATYRIEVQGERVTNPQERAKLSVLYAY